MRRLWFVLSVLVPDRKRGTDSRQRTHQTKTDHRGPYLTFRDRQNNRADQASFPRRGRVHFDVGEAELLKPELLFRRAG